MEQVLQSFPTDFITRLQLIYADKAESIMEVLSHTRPTTFRPNTLKKDFSAVAKELQDAAITVEEVPWLEAFILKNSTLRQLEEQSLYLNGEVYVQGLSSMIPPMILNPQPGDSVLDLAAAPGSKTTQMAALMQNKGMILANDASTIRLYKLRANLEKLGVTCVQTQRSLGEIVWKRFPQVFEKTLVDVPCSMEGRFNTTKPKTIENWSIKKIKELATRQKSLLRSAVSATQVGGTIVYSTCTLAPEENEGVIDWILEREKGKVVLEPVELPEELAAPAVMAWDGKVFSEEVALTKRITPSSHYEGFFVAKLRKVAPNL